MKSQQSGFTLVEIAIVLVIIGLLLGGILKGQELINSAKVKNLANDFRTIPTYVYAFQDKFRALPGDDTAAQTHMSNCTVAISCANGNGNGVINGDWNSNTASDESNQFWLHIRLANLAPGSTTVGTISDTSDFVQKNALGGRMGLSSYVSSGATPSAQITGMNGTYQICSKGILGKFVRQLDIMLDDGKIDAGSFRAQEVPGDGSTPTKGAATADNTLDDAKSYLVCMTF